MNDAGDRRFVNPYQFVPIGPVKREPPLGHGPGSGGVYSGSITVQWAIVTPLLLPAASQGEGWTEGGRFQRIPGSSLRGAVRSLHETIFHGCLRIVDTEFVPAYRDPAVAQNARDDWRLAVVAKANDGVPERVQLCEPGEKWVSATELFRLWPGNKRAEPPTSGDLVTVHGTPRKSRLERTEIPSVRTVERHTSPDWRDDALAEAGQQVFLVTDTVVRKGFRTHGRGGCFWALGTLTDDALDVSQDTRRRFREMCGGSNDHRIRESKGGKKEPLWADAKWWLDGRQQTIGRRRQATGELDCGDAIWVLLGRGTDGERAVKQIRLAQIWRHVGEDTVGDRLPHAASPTTPAPCRPEREEGKQAPLCLSCAIFGAVDTERGGAKDGRHAAYAGHVRFSSAQYVSGPRQTKLIDLAPLSSPRPGAGVFYLDDKPRDDRPTAQDRDDDDVFSHWGSSLDGAGGPRKVRGRKFYWHSDPQKQADRHRTAPRHQANATQRSKNLSAIREIVEASPGNPLVVEATVTFDQLDEIGVRTLLLALDPSPLLGLIRGEGEFATHLGGGKPLGLGSAVPEIVKEETDIWMLSDRYQPERSPASLPDWWEAPREYAPQIQTRVGRFTAHLADLAKVLDRKGLGTWEEYVSYPPGADSWGQARTDAFRLSYQFFVEASGKNLKSRPGRYEPLPSLGDRDPSLPIVTRPQRGRG